MNHFINMTNHLATGNQSGWLSRLRINLGAINHHRFKYNFITSSLCQCCETHFETTKHFFFHFPVCHIARNNPSFQLESELQLTIVISDTMLETLLFGKLICPQNYSNLLYIVIKYLSASSRFA